MLTPYDPRTISSVGRAKTYYSTRKYNSMAQTSTTHNYDSATFSSAPAGRSAFHMNVVSRLSQEVRTTTTTGDIQELRRSVASGEYTPDPSEIAKRIMFALED